MRTREEIDAVLSQKRGDYRGCAMNGRINYEAIGWIEALEWVAKMPQRKAGSDLASCPICGTIPACESDCR